MGGHRFKTGLRPLFIKKKGYSHPIIKNSQMRRTMYCGYATKPPRHLGGSRTWSLKERIWWSRQMQVSYIHRNYNALVHDLAIVDSSLLLSGSWTIRNIPISLQSSICTSLGLRSSIKSSYSFHLRKKNMYGKAYHVSLFIQTLPSSK